MILVSYRDRYGTYNHLTLRFPDHLNSPQTVLRRQAGHSFEYATLLVSFLIGSGYDAYVVSGYASREICQLDQTRVECPFLTDEKTEETEEEIEEDSKYFLKKPVELKSLFLEEMKSREIRKQLEAQRLQELAELEAIKEFEKPWPDPLATWRLHAWVVVLPSKDILEPIFIETTTGNAKSLNDPEYHGIESIWNHENYWVLIKFNEKTTTCKDISFDLNNPEIWERLLIGEPIKFRKFTKEGRDTNNNDDDDDDFNEICINAEKHLDMSASWVDLLKLSHTVFERRFPKGKKVVNYRKAISEQYPPYLNSDGLVERVKRYNDYDCSEPLEIREKYENRRDFLYYSIRTISDNSVLDKFYKGREDALKEHFYYSMDSGIEVCFKLKFYHEARFDALSEIIMDPLFMIMRFKERPDFLRYVLVNFAERTNQAQPLRSILKITEEYDRNPEKDADKDVAVAEYYFPERKVHLKFHYEDEYITQTHRTFYKPQFAERGALLMFDPSLTTGYLTGPLKPQPKPLYLIRLEIEYFKQEEIAESKIRERENEVKMNFRLRAQELAAPKLMVSVFDTERNEEAKKAFKEKEQQIKEMKERELEMVCDFLAPYYAKLQIDPKTILPHKIAITVLNDLLTDWKNLLVFRANDIQRQFEKTCQEFNEKNNWYEQNQRAITKEQEEEYFDYCRKKSYYLHTLEVRLLRHKELAPKRYAAINEYLKNDPRMALAFRKFKTKLST
ncbi:conserved hypothetical protein [Pediculus humanus corporis]|uniref:PI-PLC Y-box domain-containing protein n=1 Tax=Pediculus humanus subsp. corporis TaxID=121224 RepID=E0VYG1_PEDHC|nr:uncharacterized protein Phum_PHUM514000 [Pediculus humanus corporis]EEB18417.1 conserved hypothetical protein [Pediculus humanus corporis]